MDEQGDDKVYWGRLPEYSEDFGEQVCENWREHQQVLIDCGKATEINFSAMSYHSRDEGGVSTTRVTYSGEKGEIVETDINEYRVLLRTKKSVATVDDLRFQPLATNDDSNAIRAQQVAKGILRHYESRGLFSRARDELAETAMAMSAGWIGAFWNPAAGELEDAIDTTEDEPEEDEPESPEQEAKEDDDEQFDWEREEAPEEESEEAPEQTDGVVYKFSGDVAVEVYNAFQVAWDRGSSDITDPEWLIVRRRVNKHLLATLLPEYRDAILDCGHEFEHPWSTRLENFFEEHDDYIWPFFCWFKPSPLVPRGRYAIVLPGGVVVADLPSKLRRVPVFVLPSSIELIGARLPYGDEFDALLPCELTKDAYSALSSRVDANTPVLSMPAGTKQSRIGMFKSFEVPDVGEVKSVTLFPPDESLYRNIDVYQTAASRVAQINPAMLGAPSKYESGSSQAYQVSQGMVQQKQFTRALAFVMGQVATTVIELLRLHMDEGRQLAIIGERNQGKVIEFNRSQLELIQNVTVVTTNPELETHEGRRQFADMAAEKGWIRSKDEWVTAYMTGSAGVLTDDEVDRVALIRSENEQIRQAVKNIPPHIHDQANQLIRGAQGQDVGQQVAQLLEGYLDPMALPQVCVSDNHREHWYGHSDMEADEAIRRDPLAKHLLQAHNTQHLLHLTPGSPVFNYQALMISGQKPLAAVDQMGMAAAPPERQPPGAEATEGPQGSAPKPHGGPNPGAAQPGLPPAMPSAPTNPGSGQAAPTPALAGAPVPSGARG